MADTPRGRDPSGAQEARAGAGLERLEDGARCPNDFGPEEVAIQIVPEWVCEALSPSTARFDRLRKLPLYAEHDVAWVWLVDPVQRLLEIYRLEKEGYLLAGVFADTMKIRAPPFDAIELDLALLWWPAARTAVEQTDPK